MEASHWLAPPAPATAPARAEHTNEGLGTVVTILEPRLRSRVDLAGTGAFRTLHLNSVLDLPMAVRDRSVRAVLLSPQVIQQSDLPIIAGVGTEFSGIVAVAISEDRDHPDLARLLELGACGAQCLIDLSRRDGLNRVRDLAWQTYGHVGAEILETVMPALAQATPDARFFFDNLVRKAPQCVTVRSLARAFGSLPSTLMSRFFRARLPSPKRYLAETRILYAAALLERRDLSVAEVAHRLGYSSPQSFGRHVRELKGVTAMEFRYRFAMRTALDRFIAELITPHERALRTFIPLKHCRRLTFGSPAPAMVAERRLR